MNTKSKLRSEFFDENVRNQLDENNPKFSMFLLAHEVVKNCFGEKYQFRNMPMYHRFAKHGVLPKSFFRQNFQRCTQLLNMAKIAGYTLDDLADEVCESDLLGKKELFERNENKMFYYLIKKD